MKKPWIIIASLLLALGVVGVDRFSRRQLSQTQSSQSPSSENHFEETPSRQPDPNPKTGVATVDPKELDFKIPDTSSYRAQVLEQEKHEGAGLPPVLRDFSQRMGELMEMAMASETFANALFDHLKTCATSAQESLIQARSICAVNALRLGKTYPASLGEKASSLRGALSPEVTSYVEALGY